jgi:hypothetical protein
VITSAHRMARAIRLLEPVVSSEKLTALAYPKAPLVRYPGFQRGAP